MHVSPDNVVTSLSNEQTIVFVPHEFNLLHLELEARWTTEDSFADANALHVAFLIAKNGALQETFVDGSNRPLKDEKGIPIDLNDPDPERNIATLNYLGAHDSTKSFAITELYTP